MPTLLISYSVTRVLKEQHYMAQHDLSQFQSHAITSVLKEPTIWPNLNLSQLQSG